MQGRRWWPWLGPIAGLAGFAWVLSRLDLERFVGELARADIRLILLVPLAIVAEQWLRAWKWRQLLHGYLINILVPFGFSALVRSWLVARREGFTTSGVVATVALDRLSDGIVFAFLVPAIGALALWRQGVALAELRKASAD